MAACGQVDKALYLRSEGLGYDSHCWSCAEGSGKLLILYCLCLHSSNGYLVETKTLENCERHELQKMC